MTLKDALKWRTDFNNPEKRNKMQWPVPDNSTYASFLREEMPISKKRNFKLHVMI